MRFYNFSTYDAESEMPGGDYWKLLDANSLELEESGIYFFDFMRVWNGLKNEELKLKIKDKLMSLAKQKGIFFNGIENCLSIFNMDELMELLVNEFDNKIMLYLSTPENIRRYNGDIFQFIYVLNKIEDKNFGVELLAKILESIKFNSDKTLLIEILEYEKRNNITLYNRLINDYYDYFPEEYRELLRIRMDSNYCFNKALEFERRNIDIGIDPRISIAPEIEANKRYPFDLDLYGQYDFENRFYVDSDATVPNGNEIIPTKPFHNTPEDVARFCALCETMRAVGYYYDEEYYNAAGQINLGLDYLDTKEAILAFYEIYGNCEALLYYISSEEGQIFRQNIYTSSRIKPLSEIIGKRVVEEDLSREEVIRLFSNDSSRESGIRGLTYKKNSVCLRGTNKYDYRFEFRIPNGGCNYETWIDNIRLYGKMMEKAKQIADLMKKDYLTAEEESLLRLKIDLQDRKLSLEDKLEMLLDLLFEDENIKQIYRDRYLATVRKIYETRTDNYSARYSAYDPGFDEVEFIEHYQSRLDPDYEGYGVVSYDPETDEMKVGRRK